MENIQPDMEKRPDLAIFADMFDHRCEIRLYGVQSLGDVAQISFKRVHAGPQTRPIAGDWFRRFWWPASAQYRVDVLRMPTQRGRERFQGPGIGAALGGFAVLLAHDGHRDLSPLGEFALPPVELGKPRINRSRDRHPVLRHLFLRAPP